MPNLSKRKFTVRRHPVIVDVGCGCRRSKLSSLFSSFPKPKKPHHYFSTSTSTTPSATTTASSSFFSFQEDSPQKPTTTTTRPRSKKKKNPKGRLVGDSVAIEKDSSEPYLDFRESMVQMIVENQIYGWDELRELLHHLLSLNSPQYHPLILRAFSDVCQAIFSHPSP